MLLEYQLQEQLLLLSWTHFRKRFLRRISKPVNPPISTSNAVVQQWGGMAGRVIAPGVEVGGGAAP